MKLNNYLANPTISYVRTGKPYPNFWGVAHTHPDLLSVYGARISCAVYLFYQAKAYYFLDSEDWTFVKKTVVQKLFDNPDHVGDCFDKVRVAIEEGESFFQKIIPNLKEISNSELSEIVKKFHTLFLQIQMYGDFTYYMSEAMLNQKLARALEAQLKDPKDVQNTMSILSNFDSLSFLEREKLELAKIAVADSAGIVDHIARWRHKTYDYWGPVTPDQEFYDRLEIYKKNKTKTEELVKSLSGYEEDQKKKKNAIIEKFGLNDEIILLGKLVSQVGYLNDTKKYGVTRFTYLFDFVLQEIASRFGQKKEILHYYLEEEIEALVESGLTLPSEEMDKRMEWNILIFKDGKNVENTTDSQSRISQELKKTIAGNEGRMSESKDSTVMCSGLPASAGEYEGVVVTMFSHNDLDKAKEGMVLVSPKTTVDFISALQQSGAVVTDYGGLTSHPAIVAREMGIPAVVGTGDATQLFRDGDIVRVNGVKGVATLIKRNSDFPAEQLNVLQKQKTA